MRVELLEPLPVAISARTMASPSVCLTWVRLTANGLADARDFLSPVAAFEDVDGNFQSLCKFQGKRRRSAGIDHSPLDRGRLAW